MRLPAVYDLTFSGFGTEAFAILDRLRENPHIEQYQKEKAGIAQHVMAPFRQFRDDLVVNVILPNRMPLETERNVFSRILKNDFGAGGSHSHVWMSFYRLGRSRLSDFQPFHGIDADGFYAGLHVGGRDRSLVRAAREMMADDGGPLLNILNGLLSTAGWTFELIRGTGTKKERFETSTALSSMPEITRRAEAISVYRSLGRAETVACGGDLVRFAAESMAAIWPLYESFTEAVRTDS